MILKATTMLEKMTCLTSFRSSIRKPSEYIMRICFKIVDLPDSPAPRSSILTCLACVFLSFRIILSISMFRRVSSAVALPSALALDLGKHMLNTIFPTLKGCSIERGQQRQSEVP